jgi:hypothetical protein
MKLCMHLHPIMCATCPVHPIPLTFCEEYKLRNSTLCSALNRPVSAPLLGSCILLHPSTYLKKFRKCEIYYCRYAISVTIETNCRSLTSGVN